MAKVAFTASRVADFRCPADRAQAFLWDATSPGLGLRVTPTGKPAYVFQSLYQGKDIRLTIGSPTAWSISQAQARAREFQRMIDQGQDPRELKAQATAISKAKEVAEQREFEQQKFNLSALLADYCDYLESLGRRSHRDARSIFELHVSQAWPKIAALPANQITFEHIADMMRRLHEMGKGRTSNKLRSYIRAAYQVAKASRSKASIPLRFKCYGVSENPAAETEPDETQNRPDKNPLNAAEMRTYWNVIKELPGFRGAVLRLHLLTGGLRIEQLVNLKTVDASPNSITLYDGKGRPGTAPRQYSTPLIPAAALALSICHPQGLFALSTDGGNTHLSASTFSEWSVKAGAEIPGFAAKRIRSGVETLLASAKVNSDIRGRLQSHGISGVQNRHYDGHEYVEEKRQALDTLFTLLDRSTP